MLHAAANLAPRGVYVCGNTTSTSGLTVTLSREAGGSGDFALEAGALVLADQGEHTISYMIRLAMPSNESVSQSVCGWSSNALLQVFRFISCWKLFMFSLYLNILIIQQFFLFSFSPFKYKMCILRRICNKFIVLYRMTTVILVSI